MNIYLLWAVLQFIARVSGKEHDFAWRHMPQKEATLKRCWMAKITNKVSFCSANSMNKVWKILITEIWSHGLVNEPGLYFKYHSLKELFIG